MAFVVKNTFIDCQERKEATAPRRHSEPSLTRCFEATDGVCAPNSAVYLSALSTDVGEETCLSEFPSSEWSTEASQQTSWADVLDDDFASAACTAAPAKSKKSASAARRKRKLWAAATQMSCESKSTDGPTTLMLRNLPNNYTRVMLLELLVQTTGSVASIDFVYLPVDFAKDANYGYAFVNFVDHDTAECFRCLFQGFTNWALPSCKVGAAEWTSPHQGRAAHVERFRNSPVMHKAVPDRYKPMVFEAGVRRPFPEPTKRVPRPQVMPTRCDEDGL